jgi:hypothetical protein
MSFADQKNSKDFRGLFQAAEKRFALNGWNRRRPKDQASAKHTRGRKYPTISTPEITGEQDHQRRGFEHSAQAQR